MIVALVQFKLPDYISDEQVEKIFFEVAPKFGNVPGLIRKYFLLSEDGKTGGGSYFWQSREDSDRFYTDEFKKSIAELFGSPPSIAYFDTPLVIDNLANDANITA